MASPERPPWAVVRERGRWRLSFENRIFVLALAAGVAPAAAAFALLWTSPLVSATQWIIVSVTIFVWLTAASAVRTTVVRPLKTLANLQAAIREGDFSIRARATGVNDSLSELIYEINELAATLQGERLGAFEANALTRKVLTEIDVAVFAFDAKGQLRVINRAAERLVGQVSERAIGLTAERLGIGDLLAGSEVRTLERSFPGGTGRWGVRRTTFRQGGVPHQLVVVTDLSRALREEERQAWQRLVRVLGHELNNSLAPIKSISQSLQGLFRREPRPADWEEDVERGLQVIADRSEALARFMADYSRLARLPKPNLQQVALAPLLRRVASLDRRVPVHVDNGPDVVIEADPDQLEQLAINILRNAIDATVDRRGSVTLSWRVSGGVLRIRILDEGHGITNSANLFVPFFTTKPGGSGIGLALSRQIAEAHGGEVSLMSRRDGEGSEAVITLPLHR